MALTAMLSRRYATDAEPSAVVDWFNAELSARGRRPALTRPNLHIYERGSEVFALGLGKPERPRLPMTHGGRRLGGGRRALSVRHLSGGRNASYLGTDTCEPAATGLRASSFGLR